MDSVLARGLVDAWQAFAASGLCEMLDEEDTFAVRFGSGSVGYCYAAYDDDDTAKLPTLELLMDGAPMASHLRMRRAEGTSPVQYFQAFTRLEQVMCLGVIDGGLSQAERQQLESAGVAVADGGIYPSFRQKNAFEESGPLRDEALAGNLRQALRAAAYLAGQLGDNLGDPLYDEVNDERAKALGFDREDIIPVITVSALSKDGFLLSTMPMPDDIPVRAASVVLDDPELVTMIRAKRMRGKAALVCELVSAPLPLDTQPPRYPVGLLMMAHDRKIFSFPFVEDFAGAAETLMGAFVDLLLEHGMPASLSIRDETTALLLHGLCEQLALPIKLARDIPMLDGFIDAYYDHVMPDEDDDEYDDE